MQCLTTKTNEKKGKEVKLTAEESIIYKNNLCKQLYNFMIELILIYINFFVHKKISEKKNIKILDLIENSKNFSVFSLINIKGYDVFPNENLSNSLESLLSNTFNQKIILNLAQIFNNNIFNDPLSFIMENNENGILKLISENSEKYSFDENPNYDEFLGQILEESIKNTKKEEEKWIFEMKNESIIFFF